MRLQLFPSEKANTHISTIPHVDKGVMFVFIPVLFSHRNEEANYINPSSPVCC